MKNNQVYIWLIVVLLSLSGCQQAITSNKSIPIAATDILNITPTVLPTSVASKPSPPCQKIAFVINKEGDSNIYTICPDGSQLSQITHGTVANSGPAWSPDGTKIAYVSSQTDRNQIYMMDELGKKSIQLTFENENDLPIWLPNGLQIAYRSTDSQGLWWWEILTIAENQTIPYSEASYDFFFQTPAWSPDGRQIAYMSLTEQSQRNDGSSQLHVKNSDGSNDIALTKDVWANKNPVWSPDGNRIAFLSERDGIYNQYALYIISDSGNDLQRLTEPIFTGNNTISWSPDGEEIAIDEKFFPDDIRIIHIDTGQIRILLPMQNGQSASSPAWQPKSK